MPPKGRGRGRGKGKGRGKGSIDGVNDAPAHGEVPVAVVVVAPALPLNVKLNLKQRGFVVSFDYCVPAVFKIQADRLCYVIIYTKHTTLFET